MDWINEFIGFLIVLFVFLFPLLRKLLIDKKKQTDRKVLPQDSINPEEEEQKPALQSVIPTRISTPIFSPYPLYEAAKNTKKEISKILEPRSDVLGNILRKRRTLHAMVILSEIYGSPKGFE
jgi:hypothetical protein